jgi:hypothetical protein
VSEFRIPDETTERMAKEKPREFLSLLIDRGVKLGRDLNELSDSDCERVIKHIWFELTKREYH